MAGEQIFDYRAFFEHAPGLYLVLDTDFRVVTANDSYCRSVMSTREAMGGHSVFALFADEAGAAMQELRASLMRVLETRRRDADPAPRRQAP